MKLKATTIALLLTAVACGVGVFMWTQSQDKREEEVTEQQERTLNIFSFSEDQVAELTVITPKLTLAFERSQQSFPHTWRMKKPKDQLADEAAIAFLLNQLVTTKSPRTLSVEPSRQKEFGFDQSPGRVQVILNNKQSHQLIFGGIDPTESLVYAQVDPDSDPKPTQKLQVALVPTAFLSAINRPLKEWQVKQPQAQPTVPATPSPSIDPGPSIPLPPPQVPQ